MHYSIMYEASTSVNVCKIITHAGEMEQEEWKRERKRVNEKDTQYYRRPGEWQAMKMYAIVITRLGNNRIMAGK